MFIFYEEDGQFKTGRIMQESDANMQVESASGRRSKVKTDKIIARFDTPSPQDLLEQAQIIRDEADPDFLWEAAGADEFDYQTLAEEYFGHKPSAAEAIGILLRLHESPMYFYRKGKGRYKPAPKEALIAAKAGLERKRREAEQIAVWLAELLEFRLPQSMSHLVPRIALKPDKNTLEFKAFEEACKRTGVSPIQMLDRCGVIPDRESFHLQAFLLDNFPSGIEFPEFSEPIDPPELPLADVAAFSMDDEATTEIDDAFSVSFQPEGRVRVGIHIACPALGIPPGSQLDTLARDRLSTVYYPGGKITMLPESLIHHYTLGEQRDRPALSLYLTVASDFRIASIETRLETVRIAANLRHERLDAQFNEETIGVAGPNYPYRRELEWLWGFAASLEALRGAANQTNRLDYNFKVQDGRILIEPRRRGSPIDKVVSELMILTNATWGTWLAEHRIPGIYRNQSQGKTRMATQPGPHQGLGVENYAWSSSPLRRYVDLVNQRQVIALLRGETPVYPPRSELLFSTVRDFELAYDAYAEFQRKMERYWCLRWIEQENRTEMTGRVIRDNLVRFDEIPFVARIPGLPDLDTGTGLRLRILEKNDLEIELRAEVKEIFSAADVISDDSVKSMAR
jgi:exoribonuclease II